MTVIKLKPEFNTYALNVVMAYRGVSVSKLCENVKGLYREDVSRFLEGYHGTISEEKLKHIMEYLNWPYEFLYKDLKPLTMSKQEATYQKIF